MPYSEAWDETTPTGATQASQIDELFRSLKQQIRERMNTVLDPTGQWDDDPIKLASSALVGEGNLVIPGIATVGASSYANAYAQLTTGAIVASAECFISLPLSTEWKIKEVVVTADRLTAGSITMEYYRYPFSSPATPVTLGTITTSAAGILSHTVFSSVAGEQVLNQGYGVRLSFNQVSSSARLYGVSVWYTDG